MASLLEVKNLKKYFKTSRGILHAVDDISFQIEKGKTLGVVGESGCGKSTLGRTIIHLIPNTDGKIFFEGKDVTRVRGKELYHLQKDMQIIFQDPFSSLNPRMNLYQIISEPFVISKEFSKAEIETQVRDLMERVGIPQRLENAYPHELDGGRRQRVGIARALALKPKFIVCDEPVSALDVSIQAQVINLMLDLQDELELTYLFITHDLSVVKFISQDILVMYLGQMVEQAASETLFERPLHPYTQALLSAIPEADIHKPMKQITLKGEITSPINPKPGCRFAARCPHAKAECFKENPKLLEVEPEHFLRCHLFQ